MGYLATSTAGHYKVFDELKRFNSSDGFHSRICLTVIHGYGFQTVSFLICRGS